MVSNPPRPDLKEERKVEGEEAARLALQRQIEAFIERCREIRGGSPNAFYQHVDAFCKAALLPPLPETEGS